MNKVKLEVYYNTGGTDFLIKNFSELSIQVIKKLEKFALERNGYFQYELERFGIKKKLNEKHLLQIFEHLEIDVIIVDSSILLENESMTNQIIDFGKYKGYKWSEVSIKYLKWFFKETENRFAYEEIKRREYSITFDIENTSIGMGKYKGQKWVKLPTDYLEWILSEFEDNHENYKFGKIVLNQRREYTAFDIEDTIIGFGKYKGQRWLNLPTDYLEWILTKFKDNHENYKFAQVSLNQKID